MSREATVRHQLAGLVPETRYTKTPREDGEARSRTTTTSRSLSTGPGSVACRAGVPWPPARVVPCLLVNAGSAMTRLRHAGA